jgi:phosphoribosylformylglycinamidine cyclo-ligase
MPGMYNAGDYDLAGFCVGIVEKNKIIDGSKVKAGDAVIGIASSGVHSNGYSLVRKILEVTRTDFNSNFHGDSLGNVLLTPTKIYVKSLLELLKSVDIHAIAHITGGGLLENLPRVLPKNLSANIDKNTWQRPPIFNWLQQNGNVVEQEMLRTFNCGIGMAICVENSQVTKTLAQLEQTGETAWQIGEIIHGNDLIIN